ncbi:MAG: M28 family metallopeptidase [Planctomycetota bacterium]|jgi:hypothetical protein
MIVKLSNAALVATMLILPLQAQAADQAAVSSALPKGAPEAMARVDQEGLKRHAYVLASDEFEGRYTGTAGQLKAAAYIAEQFMSFGVEALGDQPEGGVRSFYQEFEVARSYLETDESGIEIGGETFRSGYGILAGAKSAGASVEGVFHFIGTGSPKNLPEGDLSKVIPVAHLRAPPLTINNPQIKMGAGLRQLFIVQGIAKRLAAKGAKSVLICMGNDENGIPDMVNMMGLTPEKHSLSFGGGISLTQDSAIPVAFANSELSARILGTLKVSMDEDGKPVQAELKEPVKGSLKLIVKEDPAFRVPNVVGYIKGSDPELAQEAVIYSAHMDHMGMRMDGDAFNGADDNASGSAALLEIAEAFANGPQPKRSVIFLSVSGEELGLWGSEYYASNPTWDLKKLVANINIDMIGRIADISGESEVSVTPSYRHKMYSSIGRRSAELAEQLGLGLTIGDKFYSRSDHYNFAKKNIPVVFFCDGEHEDYHQVTDHAEKLNYRKMEMIARLAYWTGWDVSNSAERPVVLGKHRGWLGKKR